MSKRIGGNNSVCAGDCEWCANLIWVGRLPGVKSERICIYGKHGPNRPRRDRFVNKYDVPSVPLKRPVGAVYRGIADEK